MTGPLHSLHQFDIASARSLLFVPGSRPDRFYKASSAQADGIILDLEDAVAPENKITARKHVHEWLSAGGRGVVRVNSTETPWHDDDVRMVAQHGCAVMLPKAETVSELVRLRHKLRPEAKIVPLIESALGILRSYELCSAPGVARAAFGNVDLAAQLGIDHQNFESLLAARSQLVLASAAATIASPLDGVTTDLGSDERTTVDAGHAAALGFTGKLCVHPRQIVSVHLSFTPTESELRHAQQIVNASGDGSAVAFKGQMIDRPVIERAQRLIARGAAKGNSA